ncbi:MAG TPA: FliG C-terminal domain-containing protein, partial [bacterium]|nr:FliG C-terminal domain-containing protein [bacterium]
VSGGLDRVAEILDLMDENTRNRVLEELGGTNPEMSEKIRTMVFTFDQLAQLDDPTLQTILGEVSAVDIAIAIKNAADDVRNRLMGNLSEAARRIVEEEMEAGRAAQASELAIQEKRRQIIEKVRALEAEGRITIMGVARKVNIEPEELTAGETAEPSLMDEVERELKEDGKKEGDRLSRLRKKLEEEEKEEEQVLDNDKAFEHFNSGVDYYKDGQYGRARTEFEESLKFNPNIWQTHQYLGGSFFAMDQEEEGLVHYDKALELNPGNQKLKEWVEKYKAEKVSAKQELSPEAEGIKEETPREE